MLSEQVRAKIRLYLGVTPKYPNVSADLEQALDAMDGNPEDESLLVAEVARCDKVATAIENMAGECVKVVEVDGTQLRAAYGLAVLRSQGRQYTAALSRTLGIPVKDGGYFTTSGASSVPGPMGNGRFPPYG